MFCKERPLTRACFCRFLSSMLLQKRMFVFVYSLLEYERLTVLNFLLNSSTCKCSGKLCHLWELIIFDNFKEDFIWPIGGVVIIEYSKTIFSWRWQSDRVSQMNRNSQETEIVTFNVKNTWFNCKFIYQPLAQKGKSFKFQLPYARLTSLVSDWNISVSFTSQCVAIKNTLVVF